MARETGTRKAATSADACAHIAEAPHTDTAPGGGVGEKAPRHSASDDAASEEALSAAAQAGVELIRDERGLFLAADGMELRVDFADELARLRPANLSRELLVRAAKVKGARGRNDSHGACEAIAACDGAVGESSIDAGASGADDKAVADETPFAVDATAGLGTDSLLLAAAGFRVLLFESDPVIAALLRDALRRAAANPALAETVNRMRLVEGDSVAGLHAIGRGPAAERPDVVYLDPMFPERTKSAAVKKKFQLLHRLERPCGNPEALLEAARAARPRKIVIKRPAKGPHLAGVKPSYSIGGKAVRYDVIALPPDVARADR